MPEIYNNPHTPTPTNHEEARKKQEKKKAEWANNSDSCQHPTPHALLK